MRIAMQEDDELALLKHTITYGWPSTIREVPSELQAYWTFREELTFEDGIVLKETYWYHTRNVKLPSNSFMKNILVLGNAS